MKGKRRDATGDLLTLREVADLLKRSPKTLHNWRLLGKGPPALKSGRGPLLFSRADVNEWFENTYSKEE